MDERDTQERKGQRRMTKERKIKTENTFTVLQKENTEPLQEEKEPPKIIKIDKDEKKICKGKGRKRIRKDHSERKRESEMGPKPGLPKNYSNEGILQSKNRASSKNKNANINIKKEEKREYNIPQGKRESN